MSGRRTLRSGKEFSAFDLAVGRAVSSPVYFSVADTLRDFLFEQDATGILDEEEPHDEIESTLHEVEQPALPAPAPSPSLLPPATLSAAARNKLKSRARRDKQRNAARMASANPLLKAIHHKCVKGAKTSALEVDIDATELPHSKPAWLGSRSAADEKFVFTDPQTPHDLDTGLGGRVYTQEEVDSLSGTVGFMYIRWLGRLTIPLLDSQRRIIAVLGGTPRDVADWKVVTDGAAALMDERIPRLHLTDERLHHRRVQDTFPAIARGISHGGGQTEPGETVNNVSITQVTNELLAHEYFQRIATFANILFAMWAPMLFAFYTTQLGLLTAWKAMNWNFAGSIFAACVFNFGPRAITAPHIDFANLSWGWCSITALGDFDPDLGGHLILWDLRLVIRFPPGSTVMIPSALIRHSNVPIRAHERRSSFTQYTAGGLFRWVRNGCKTDEAWEKSASDKDKAARAAENATRWEKGVNMFSVIDDL